MRLSRNGRCVTVKHGLPLGCTPLAPDQLERTAKPRPPRGEYRLEQRGKKRSRKLAEEKVMAEAVRRDGGRCRFSHCQHKGLLVGAAHMDHRKMGGNPLGDKTERHKLITLCIRHHDQFDGRTLPFVYITPIDAVAGTDGPCACREERNGVKVLIGISSPGGR